MVHQITPSELLTLDVANVIEYYLKNILKFNNFQIIGLDLKKDVIDNCNQMVTRYNMGEHMKFLVGDIHNFDASQHFTTQNQDNQVDMVVSLHACNTATDKALEQSVKWGAKCIMAVPCCHHELYQQFKRKQDNSSDLQPLLKHGILSERFASLLTDAMRCHLLEMSGYRTTIQEFTELEHTAKNLMIRAIKSQTPTEVNNQTKMDQSKYMKLRNELGTIQLEKLLFPHGLHEHH